MGSGAEEGYQQGAHEVNPHPSSPQPPTPSPCTTPPLGPADRPADAEISPLADAEKGARETGDDLGDASEEQVSAEGSHSAPSVPPTLPPPAVPDRPSLRSCFKTKMCSRVTSGGCIFKEKCNFGKRGAGEEGKGKCTCICEWD